MTGLTDCCPVCLDMVAPQNVRKVSAQCVRAAYTCTCGHAWFTSWNPTVLAGREAS